MGNLAFLAKATEYVLSERSPNIRRANNFSTFGNMEAIKNFVLDEEEAYRLERISFILRTVAHPIRLGIIRLLEIHPQLSVTEICEQLRTEQSLTSHHLQNLRLKGIISVRKDGRKMFYSLKERDVPSIIECLDNCNCNMC
jgi:ArsR family transcriptional regulator